MNAVILLYFFLFNLYFYFLLDNCYWVNLPNCSTSFLLLIIFLAYFIRNLYEQGSCV